jgi:small nuclear ribonucleoprotein (snRNP)-like protein
LNFQQFHKTFLAKKKKMTENNLYLPGAASIIDQLDSRLLIILRDGRNIIGTLRSFDQYLNLVLERTIERMYFEGL